MIALTSTAGGCTTAQITCPASWSKVSSSP
jgi:hypothetical protein